MSPQTTSLALGTPLAARLADMTHTLALSAAQQQQEGEDVRGQSHGEGEEEEEELLHAPYVQTLRALQAALHLPVSTPAPYLLDMASAPCVRPRHLLGLVAAALGLPLYVLDARLLWEFGAGRMLQLPALTCDDGSMPSNRSCCHTHSDISTCAPVVVLASSASAAVVSTYAPCILFIEGLDCTVADVKGLQSGGEGDSLAASVKQFLSDWQQACEPSAHSHSSRDRERHSVLTVAATAAAANLSRPIRQAFPATLRVGAVVPSTSSASATKHTPLKPTLSQLVKDVPNGLREAVRAALVLLGPTKRSRSQLRQEAHRQAHIRSSTNHWSVCTGFQAMKTKKKAKKETCSSHTSKQSRNVMTQGAEPAGAGAGKKWLDVLPVDVLHASEILQRCHYSPVANNGSDAGASGGSIAAVRWEDIGGLETVRQEILDLVELPRKRPELFPPGCPVRRAVLLFGPPGTGKTLVARAVATECDMHFISVKGPELLDVYVGESEANVRRVFSRARAMQPCVVFFDELDALAPARGRGGDGGGVMDRVVSQILTEMDSLSAGGSTNSDEGVFVIGATNRPDLLDGALLRPGRFDRSVYLSPCKQVSAREAVLRAQTRSLQLATDVQLLAIAQALPGVVTGADIGAVVGTAVAKARRRLLQQLKREALAATTTLPSQGDLPSPAHVSRGDAIDAEEEEEESDDDDDAEADKRLWDSAAYIHALPAARLQLLLKQADLMSAVEELRPSVSEVELRHYEKLAGTYGANV